ncbi:MAG: hypothetical protein V3R54_06685 [Thermodesulfovibrionia bacterium]
MKSEVKKSVAVDGLKPPTRDTFLTGFTKMQAYPMTNVSGILIDIKN